MIENITRICTKCNTEKNVDDFHQRKTGIIRVCKECTKIYDASRAKIRNQRSRENYQENKQEISQKHAQYYEENKDIINTKAKEAYEENPEKFKERNKKYYDGHKKEHAILTKKWREENPERMNELHKEWSKDNPDKVKLSQKKYKENNKEKIRISSKQRRLNNLEKFNQREKNYRINNRDKINTRRREKRKTNPEFAIKDRLRARFGEFLRYHDLRKSNTTKELIGCSYEDLVKYLKTLFYPNKEGIMMQENDLCTQKTNIDHIIPCWKFDLTNSEEQKQCFHHTNLQPLWKEDHDIKSKKDLAEYYDWKRSNLPLQEYLQLNPIQPLTSVSICVQKVPNL